MMRILLFIATNLAVIIVASITLSLLGIDGYVSSAGLDLTNLLIFCFVFGMLGSGISLLMSKPMAKWSTGTEIIEQASNTQEQWLLDTVADLAKKAGIGMPEVGIFPSYQSNAFATGWNKNSALVAVSSALLENMNEEEVRAVIGHEIGHIANGDMVTLTLIQGVVNTFVMFFARIIAYGVSQLFSSDEEEGEGESGESFASSIAFFVTTLIAEIILGILASTIVMWFSRRREYRADEAGAQLVSKAAMISALQRLQAEHEMADQMPATMTAFGINKGSSQRSLIEVLFSSHPPIEERIQALRNS